MCIKEGGCITFLPRGATKYTPPPPIHSKMPSGQKRGMRGRRYISSPWNIAQSDNILSLSLRVANNSEFRSTTGAGFKQSIPERKWATVRNHMSRTSVISLLIDSARPVRPTGRTLAGLPSLTTNKEYKNHNWTYGHTRVWRGVFRTLYSTACKAGAL